MRYYGRSGIDKAMKAMVADGTPRYAIEFGALDGRIGSNIRHFLESGWRGLWCEPHPGSFERLVANAKGLDVRCEQVAISDRDGEIEFHCYAKPGHSSAWRPRDRRHQPQAFRGKVAKTVTVRQSRLEPLLDQRDIGILSVDTEGGETAILKDVMACGLRPHIIVVEAVRVADRRNNAIVLSEYRAVRKIGDNQLFEWTRRHD